METQFDKLKAMRERRDAPATTPEREQRASPEQIKAEQERLAAGERVGGEPPPPDPDDDDDDDAPTPPVDDTKKQESDQGDDETVRVRAHERGKPGEQPAAPPGTEAIELDGKTVYVAPELAQAFRDAETAKVDARKDAEADALVDRVAAKVKEALPPLPVAKTQAELDAERALADAEAAVEKHPMPDAKLQISDPEAFASQLKAHIDEKTERSAKLALAEQRKRDEAAAASARQANEARAEEVAREQLGIQFYGKFKVLNDAATKPLVDVLLQRKWDEVKERLKTNPPKTAAEGEAFKKKCFDEVAADATRQIVAIRQQGAAAPQPPAPEPPKVASSRAPTPRATPAEPPKKEREKYPAGSMSAMLASHKAVKEGKKDAAA